MDYPAIVEEGGSERNLTQEGFDGLIDLVLVLFQHDPEMRANNREHQHIVFPVHSMHCEIIQESDDVFRPWVCPNRLGRKVTMDLDLVVLASEV